jgi:hypothetical protein
MSKNENVKETYRVPKREIKVDIVIDKISGSNYSKEYTLFLNEFSRFSSGEETIYEYLNSNIQFIPLKAPSSNELLIVNIDDIIYIKEKENSDIPSCQELIVFFREDFELKVKQYNQLPKSHSRIIDYLNQENRFVSFLFENQKIYINKNKIMMVKEN